MTHTLCLYLAARVRHHSLSGPQDRSGPSLRDGAPRVRALLDTFLVAEHAAELTLEVFERWCQTQAHLKSGIQRTQMRMVRNLCLYRRRTEPACFVPDVAFFPPSSSVRTALPLDRGRDRPAAGNHPPLVYHLGLSAPRPGAFAWAWCCSTPPVCAGVSCCASPSAIMIPRPIPS